MKYLLLILLSLSTHTSTHAQQSGPREITPADRARIQTKVEKEAQQLRLVITGKDKDGWETSAEEIAFTLDTFRINTTAALEMEIDYSTVGMVEATTRSTKAYDQLLNKYYTKLLAKLSPTDKQALIKAQRAWISYRDAEQDLIVTMAQDQYSGGGTIQQLNMASAFSSLVIRRTIEIFQYYNDIARQQ